MSAFQLSCNDDLPLLALEDFPPYLEDLRKAKAEQISGHLTKLLKHQGQGIFLSLRLPSVLALSAFYGCSILDVLDGLILLRKHHYEYQMNGLDADVLLHDPQCRKTHQ